MIVVDLGCAPHEAPSIEYLVRRFRPAFLYGFDPLLSRASTRHINGTIVKLSPKAAWTHDGHVVLHRDGRESRVWYDLDNLTSRHPCFDVARFLRQFPLSQIVLKLDVEGAEYPILERLYDQGVDRQLKLVLVEWHQDHRVPLRCPVEEWER